MLRMTWELKKNVVYQGVWFFAIKSESGVRNVLEHCRDEGTNCLLTTTLVSCTAQYHIGDRGHPYNTLCWLFEPLFTMKIWQEHYLTQMLLAINWHYWQEGKKFMHAYEGLPHASAIHWNPPGFHKNIRLDSLLSYVVYIIYKLTIIVFCISAYCIKILVE